MRFLVLTTEPADVARASGTAVAVDRLRRALAAHDVETPVMRPDDRMLRTLARARFHHQVAHASLNGYDAVLGVNGDGWQLADRLDVPFIALIKAFYAGALHHEHGLTRLLLALNSRWEGEGARRADAVVAPSQFAASAVQRAYNVNAATLHVVPEAFDLDAWRAMLPARSRSGVRVLCVAHLYPRKRVVDLLEAWPLVRRARPDARLDIVGGGPELRRLARRAEALEACFLHGHIDHPKLLEFYARADVFCLPSAQETFGYAAVEAMASGLPLVIAGAGALPEVCSGAVAEVVSVGAPSAIARALTASFDADIRARAAAVNPHITEAFSPDLVAARMIDVIAEARGGVQRRAGGSASRSATSRR